MISSGFRAQKKSAVILSELRRTYGGAYQSAITFKPQFTLWLSCNDLPLVTDKSLFASERIKVIEFNRHFSPQEQDTHLKDELTTMEAMSGIFMWLVRGYIRYKEHGLSMSEELKKGVLFARKSMGTVYAEW